MSEFLHERDLDKVKAKLIEEFPALTEQDFAFENNNELLIHLQQKLGKSKEELREIVRKI